MFGKTKMIAEYELGLLYRDRVFSKVLGPGKHRYPDRDGTFLICLDLRKVPANEVALDALYLSHPAVVAKHFAIADMGESEVGLVRIDGKLVDLVGPGAVAFYAKQLGAVTVETVDAAATIDVPAGAVPALRRLGGRGLIDVVTVPADRVGVLAVDGAVAKPLGPGRYGFYTAVRDVEVRVFDLRLQTLEVTGQELLTKDRIGIRANVTAIYKVADVLKAVATAADVTDYLYKAVQFALREVIGTRTLEQVLGDKDGINAAMAERLVPVLEEAGLAVTLVGVKDVILPGDVRELMNRVIEAEKTAQANVIKRREETAATRSLLNTAELMASNPVLMRLKELEALEKVAEKVGTVTVTNGLGGVLEDLVRLRPRQNGKGE